MPFFLQLNVKKSYREKFVEQIEHMAVVHSVAENGRLTSHLAIMAVLSGAIAILGLLLSSPAVVIGAMLLSPLMGPIMAFGLALCILDFDLLKESLASMVCGIVLAMAVAYGIVYMSPITDATPEILARTQPNLFDLLVAVFSGFAGGYAMIHRKGETIVGVAIATALMPPLAVIGYGLATGQWNITRGASLLFMTNLLAIALSVTALAKWYGFGARHSPRHTIWQTILILGVFGALSLPLGVALKNIATKTYITKTARAILDENAAKHDAHVSQFSIAFPQDKPVQVTATMLTRRYLPEEDKTLDAELTQQLGQPVKLEIDQLIVAHAEEVKKEPQIVVASNPIASPAVALPPASMPEAASPAPDVALVAYARDTLGLPVKGQQVDAEHKTVTLIIGHEPAISGQALQEAEKNLAARFPGWTTHLVPETPEGAALPAIQPPAAPFNHNPPLSPDGAKPENAGKPLH